MQFRKLDRSEHYLTRPLYEEVFSEDDERFVDYYYNEKTKDNEIYVAEDENGIHGMVHLNPFSVRYQGKVQTLHYIVAVATQEAYRHQGLMRRLLALAEQDMEQAGERLTFLMPASERIYAPFGYRFFGWQRRGMLCAENAMQKNPVGNCRPVCPEEYEALANWVNEELGRQYKLYVVRDSSYYSRLCKEQESQSGAVMVICRENEGNGQKTKTDHAKNQEWLGTFCTALEEDGTLVFREIILNTDHTEEAQKALCSYLMQMEQKEVRVEGCSEGLLLQEEQEVPLFMGKVPGEGSFTGLPRRETVFLNEVV